MEQLMKPLGLLMFGMSIVLGVKAQLNGRIEDKLFALFLMIIGVLNVCKYF